MNWAFAPQLGVLIPQRDPTGFCFDADVFAVDTGNPNHVNVYDYEEEYLGMMFYIKCDLYIIWNIGRRIYMICIKINIYWHNQVW